MHTPKIITWSQTVAEKCKPGPIKAKVSASQTKQMVLAFMHNKVMVCNKYMPRGAKEECGLHCHKEVSEGSLSEKA
jgi:hypothetical protein